MAMTCLGASIAATSIAAALFTGVVPQGALTGEILSLVLAGATGVAVASASALDS
jgi:ribosomal protein S3